MKEMVSEVTIGNYVFRHVNSVSIASSWKGLFDKAEIKLPNIKGMLGKINPGDAVEVKLGYDGDLYTEFTGYVSSTRPSTPFVVNCMDEMWKLTQETVSYSWESVSLKTVLETLVPDADVQTYDITLAPFRLDRVTKAQALEKLKQEYGLTIYFRSGKLYAGLAYLEEMGKVVYHFQKNAIEGNLEYKTESDLKIKVKGISMQPDNTRFEVDYGDSDGEIHTLHYYNKTKAELTDLIKEQFGKMKYEGYRGHFVGKGIPRAKHSMIAVLQDDRYPERAGEYFIDAVLTTYNGSGGFSREIELGKKAA